MDPWTRYRIRALGLSPHPEGGWYRETFRSPRTVVPADGRGARSAVTTIEFLLAAGEISRWHRVESDEVWCLLEGGPLELWIAPPDLCRVERLDVVGSAVVAAGWWQAARTSERFALTTCVVAPGFAFEDFALLADFPEACEALRAASSEAAALL